MGNHTCLTSDTCRGAHHVRWVSCVNAIYVRPAFAQTTMSPPSNRLRKPSHVDLDNTPQQRGMSPRPAQDSDGHLPSREPYPVPSSSPASQYTLLDKLGTGSFGTVYKAMHNETKQIVAIKQIGAFSVMCARPGRFHLLDLSYPEQTWRTRMTIYWRSSRK